ncbi:MAG: PaaI family thioesterase [Smithellaceae bacterium]|nr:PaaI family thioesterase [Smithellaceae bacterium]
MTGKPTTDELKRFFTRDTFANYVGIELLEVADGHATARLELKDHHLNGVGIPHGGAIFTLADLAFAAASNSRGQVAVAINVNISYLKATTGKALIAKAHEVSCNSKLASYTIEVADDEGEIVALMQGMVYRRSTKTG